MIRCDSKRDLASQARLHYIGVYRVQASLRVELRECILDLFAHFNRLSIVSHEIELYVLQSVRYDASWRGESQIVRLQVPLPPHFS